MVCMLRIPIALVLLLVTCAPSITSDSDSGAQSATATPSAPTAPSCVSGRRLDFLTNQFFVKYNARDLDGFLALFHFSVPAAGGGFGQYYDNPGPASTMTDRASLTEYVRRRWAMDDRFVSWSAGAMPDGLNYPNANPTVSFTRSVQGVTQDGNVKLVCNAGLLIGVVMSSGQP